VARTRIASTMFAFEQLQKFYQETAERVQPNGTVMAGPIRKGVALDKVEFTYEGAERRTISAMSMTIERGRMVAIVGPSGAGKTTLVGLIARLYDPQAGRILVDGEDVRSFDIRSWRRRIAVVAQDTFIFNASVVVNIAFGHEDATIEQVRTAARLAAADTFIEALPRGYDTILGDRGVRLSGGQQQRIAIARAILADPDLLILDEATSNLDTINERAIQNAMSQLSKDRTLLVIAHRLSTIQKADNVVVMDAGRIVEQGRHQELLARRGAYWEMVEQQRLDLVDESRDGVAEAVA
jgi:ABC-type multidrug transport system fused ATPase/permease subunit